VCAEAEVGPETTCAFVVEIAKAAVTGEVPTVTDEGIVQLISEVLAGGVQASETWPVKPLMPLTVMEDVADCPAAAMVTGAFFEST
jgi:hypothetical protein